MTLKEAIELARRTGCEFWSPTLPELPPVVDLVGPCRWRYVDGVLEHCWPHATGWVRHDETWCESNGGQEYPDDPLWPESWILSDDWQCSDKEDR